MNDRLVTEIRRAMGELADATPPTRPLDELLARRAMPPVPRRPRRFTIAAVGVSLALAIAGLVFVRSRVDDEPRTDEIPTTTVAPVTTTAATPGTTGATATTVERPTTAVPSAEVGPPDQPLPAGFEPASITWISSQPGWLLGHVPCAGGSCLSLARTRDGGKTWHGVPVPATTADGVRFANAHDGWLFGSTLWSTHDGGSTWQQVPGRAGIVTLEADAGRVYAVEGTTSSDGSGQFRLVTSVTGRDAWSVVAPMPAGVGSAISLHGSAGYVMGADGILLAISAEGLTPLGRPCGSLDANVPAVAGIAASAAGTVAAMCVFDGAAGSQTKRLVVSSDGGNAFTTAGDAPRGGTGGLLTAASPTTFVVGASGGGTILYRSTDGGATWTTVFEDGNGGAPLVDLGFTDADHGVAVMRTQPAVLLTTADGGATWTKAAIHD